MAEGSVNVTEGSGKRLHTWDRTISAVLVQDQFMLPGEYPLASYVIVANAISIGTASDHTLQIMAGSSNYVRIRRIRIQQAANATAAASAAFSIIRLTTAGTGGTAITPAKLDSGDAAASCTAMTLPTVKGTESTEVYRERMTARSAFATNNPGEDEIIWQQSPNVKPLIIPAGTANGIALKQLNAITSGTVDLYVEVVETSWLGA